MADQRETCVTHLEGEDRIGIYSSEQKNINYIKKMAEKYPGEVVINRINPDGSICADFIGGKWVLMPRHKQNREFTPEHREAMAQRMNKLREAKKEGEEN